MKLGDKAPPGFRNHDPGKTGGAGANGERKPKFLQFRRMRLGNENLFNPLRGNSGMAEEGIVARREKDAALSVHRSNAAAETKFYLDMAGFSKSIPIPQKTKEADEADVQFAAAEALLMKNISTLIRTAASLKEPELGDSLVRLSFAMYMVDAAKAAKDAAYAKNSLGLHSVYAALRGSVCELLTTGYYKKAPGGIVSDYVDAAPLLEAASTFSGFAALPL